MQIKEREKTNKQTNKKAQHKHKKHWEQNIEDEWNSFIKMVWEIAKDGWGIKVKIQLRKLARTPQHWLTREQVYKRIVSVIDLLRIIGK